MSVLQSAGFRLRLVIARYVGRVVGFGNTSFFVGLSLRTGPGMPTVTHMVWGLIRSGPSVAL